MKSNKALKILIVDDEAIVRETLTAIINRLGPMTEWVSDGRKGQENIKMKAYDAAFVDMRMPGLDGISFLKWLQEEQMDIPVIIMTGHGDEEARADALSSGAFAFLNKPFSLVEIKQLVKAIANRSI
jgi:DNA-binding NtrC family response regulator